MNLNVHYRNVIRASKRMREKLDCSIVAIAMLTGCRYGVAWGTLKRLGRKDRHRTPNGVTEKAFPVLGFCLEKIDIRSLTIDQLRDELPEGRFLVFTSGHALALVDGCDYDNRTGQKRVKRTFRVTEV